jgi:hypothetical protein
MAHMSSSNELKMIHYQMNHCLNRCPEERAPPWESIWLLAATRFVSWTVESSGYQESRFSISSNLQSLSRRPIMLRL